MKALILALVIFPQILLAQKDSPSQTEKLLGTWICTEEPYKVVFYADGIADLDGDRATYKTKGNKLIVNFDGDVEEYTVTLNGNTMIVADGDMDRPLKFTRVAEAKPKATSANKTKRN